MADSKHTVGDVRVVSVEEITPWKQEVVERG